MPLPFDIDLTRPEFKCVTAGKLTSLSQFKIYPISQLGLLLKSLSEQIPAKHVVLHLLDDNGQMWFAGEAAPDPSIITEFRIPMHYQMTGLPSVNAYCMTAGTIEFSSDYQTITGINNKSCTFKPTLDSLKWALASLVINAPCLREQSIQFTSELKVEEYSTGVGGFQGMFHTINTDELVAWVKTTFEKEEMGLLNQPTDIKIATYKPGTVTANPYHSFTGGFQAEEENPDTMSDVNSPGSPMITY